MQLEQGAERRKKSDVGRLAAWYGRLELLLNRSLRGMADATSADSADALRPAFETCRDGGERTKGIP